jgi:hypothetical protein
MRGKLMFLAGAAAGFVLGSRAGREKYDELVATTRRLMDHPTVREASGQVQAQATKLFDAGKQQLSNSKLADKLRHNGDEEDVALEDRRREQRMSSNSF